MVNMSKLENDIKTEKEKVSTVKESTNDIFKLKQFIGPVTVIWYDYIVESAYSSNLSKEQIAILIKHAEADIRRAVKKDKSQAVLGVIVSYFALGNEEFMESASDYCKLLSINVEKFYDYMQHWKKEEPEIRILVCMRAISYKFAPDLYEVLCKVMPAKRVNVFTRFSGRTVDEIHAQLSRVKNEFEMFYITNFVKI